MAKSKKKAAKLRLPKQIAGVKIPKSLRKGDVGQFIASPAGHAALAQVVTLAAAALAGRESHPESGVRQALSDPPRGGDDAQARLARALGEATRAFRSSLQDRTEADGSEMALESSKKKPSADTDEAPEIRH